MQTVNTPVSTALEDRINRAGRLWHIEQEISNLDNDVIFVTPLENGYEKSRWTAVKVILYTWLKRTELKLWLNTSIVEFNAMCWRIKERERVRRITKLFP